MSGSGLVLLALLIWPGLLLLRRSPSCVRRHGRCAPSARASSRTSLPAVRVLASEWQRSGVVGVVDLFWAAAAPPQPILCEETWPLRTVSKGFFNHLLAGCVP